MAANNISEEQFNEIYRAFSLFDTESDGAICQDKMKYLLIALGYTVSDEELAIAFEQLDRLNTGTVNQMSVVKYIE